MAGNIRSLGRVGLFLIKYICFFRMAQKCWCGTFTAKNTVFCKTHKKKADAKKWQDKCEAKRQSQPEKLEEYKKRRLDNQRKRNQTDPSNFKIVKRLQTEAEAEDTAEDDPVSSQDEVTKFFILIVPTPM